MKTRLLSLLLLSVSAFGTTPVTGHIAGLNTTTPGTSAFVRFILGGMGGNQPRITGTGAIAPLQGGNGLFYVDLPADASGNISGTIYSTRDAAGTGNGEIEVGGSYTAVYYRMFVYNNGIPGPEIRVHAKNGSTLDIANVTPISTNPVVTAPTGDTTYFRLDGGNSPITGAFTSQGNNSFIGSNTFKILENCRWVDSSSNWVGSDFGAKVNSALADAGARGSVCVASGSYTYSTDIVIPAPGTLICPAVHTCVLNYTGTGNAVKVGPDGLTVSTYSPDDYVVQGFLFTGGASMAEGVFVNEFIVKSHILENEFRNFGNATAYNIWEQGQNWETRIAGNYMWNVSQSCNGVIQNAADPANGTSGDFGQSQGSITGNHIQGCNTAIYVNGLNTKVSDNTLTGAPAIIIGAYGNLAKIEKNDIEAGFNGQSAPCIQFGDASGPRVASYIDSIELVHNLCNAHNSSFSTTAHFFGPATGSSGIQNTLLFGNNVADLTAGQPLVVLNNLASQNNNNAYDNKSNTTNTAAFSSLTLPSRLHSSGGSIAAWGGTDGDQFSTLGGATINGPIIVNTSNSTPMSINSKTDAQANFNLSCGLTAQQDCSINFYDHAGALKGQLFLANGGHGGRMSGINNGFQGWQVGSDGRFYVKRIQAELGTVYSGADSAIVLSAGWGTTAAVSAATGFDPSATFTVTSSGTGQAANPTITITFKDGTWSNTPGCVMNQVGGTGTRQFVDTTTPSVTAPVFTWNGTPVAASTYIFTMSCTGR